MPLPKINTLNPQTIPATVEQVYDRWYLVSLLVDSGNPLVATAIAKFKLAGTDANGNTVFHPSGEIIAERIENIFVDAQTDALLANVMGDILLVCANLREDTERCDLARPHFATVNQNASWVQSNKDAVSQALVDGTTAVAGNDSAALAEAKAASASAATSAASQAAAAATAHDAVVTAANGKTFQKIVAMVAQSLAVKDTAADNAADAATINVQVQGLTI